MIKSPDEIRYSPNERRLFLGGGISGCPDWQSYLYGCLEPISNLVVSGTNFYPRRWDVEIQAKCENPGQKIVYSLEELVADIIEFFHI